MMIPGILMNLGMVMLIEWLWLVPRVRMTRSSHLVVLSMTIFSLFFGMMVRCSRAPPHAAPQPGGQCSFRVVAIAVATYAESASSL